MKRVEKPWGWELWFENNDKYCGKLIHCNKGKWSSNDRFHYHKEKDEAFLILKGTLLLYVENEKRILKEGDTIRIVPTIRHKFVALTRVCEFIEVSTQHKYGDSYYD